MSSPWFGFCLLVIGIALGWLIAWMLGRGRLVNERQFGRLETAPELSSLRAQLVEKENEVKRLQQACEAAHTLERNLHEQLRERDKQVERLQADLDHEREAAAKRRQDELSLTNQFDALARRALSANSTQFLELARTNFEKEQAAANGNLKQTHQAFLNVVNPVGEKLAELNQKVSRLSEDKDRLATEAKNLSSALRKAEVRGRWGEIQLQRVAELAGMQNHCDFTLQHSIVTEDQRRKRPDMVVRLPLNRYVVVDSKAVMDAYISACECDDPLKNLECLKRHARLVRDKIDELAKIDYAKVLERDGKSVADMVVCFLPGEAFFSAAIAHDPGLLEYAAKNRVFLASPTILITLLRAIALGWRDHQLSANAEEVSRLGKELYARLSGMKVHFDKLGTSLTRSVDSYNAMVSSLNKKVFPQARRFRELGALDDGVKDLGETPFVEETLRSHASADWDQPLALAATAGYSEDDLPNF